MSHDRRGVGARLGIAALNLLTPGLGLLRTGDGRLALLCIAGPWAAAGLLLLYYVAGPTLTFAAYSAWVVILIVIIFATLVLSVWLSWRRSAEPRESAPWWSRWYAIAMIWLAVTAAGQGIVAVMHGYYRPFYIPGESMMPTMVRDDRIVASMSTPRELRRGDVVLVRAESGAIYVKRVAALPGDRIAMFGGVVLLNGTPVRQRHLRTEVVELSRLRQQVRRLAERLPGEAREHEIYDSSATQLDDFAEVVVRPGHVFVLGDNRDMSADSRVPRTEMGLEQVALQDVVGRAIFFSWWPGHPHSGRTITD